MSEPALLLPAPPSALVTLRDVGEAAVVDLDPAAPFESLREELRQALTTDLERLKGNTVRLGLGTRDLSLFDLRRLVHLLKDEFEVLVTGVYCTPQTLHRYVEQELKLKVFLESPPVAEDEDVSDEPTAEDLVLDEPPPPVPHPPEPLPGRRLLPVEKTVRSGATVRFNGDLLVYGDVNAGAVVMATGNILVLGRLSGLAHAGCEGDERAVIIGFDLRPTQVRIGRKIAMSPDEAAPSPRKNARTPEIAWVSGDEICIEEYRGRLPG